MTHAVHDGVRINYRVDGDGEAVVLHHGFSDSLETWTEFGYVAELSKTHTFISFDARGHGDSDKPHDPAAYTMADRAGDVIAVLDDAGVDRAHFYGVSLGGIVGYGLAGYALQRFRPLMIGAAGPEPPVRDVTRAMDAELTRGAEAFVHIWEQQGPISDALRTRLLGNDMDALQADGSAPKPDNLGDALRDAGIPALLIVGDKDFFYPAVDAYAATFPEARYVVLPGLNHYESFRQSDLALPHLTSFLAQVSGTASSNPG